MALAQYVAENGLGLGLGLGVIGRLAHDFEDGALVLHAGFLVAALRGFQA